MKSCSLTKGTLAGTFCHTSSNALDAKFDTLVWHAKGHTICLRVGDSHPRPEMGRRSIALVTTRTRRTRDVNSQHARDNSHTAYTHETSTRSHARERTHDGCARTRDVTAHAHETSMQRTLVNAHTRRPRTHTRRRRTRTLVRIRTRHARIRDVHATHARERTHTHDDDHVRVRARTHTLMYAGVEGERSRY